ncbi:MAG TPA: methyltransferase [Gammaproteobacteria bacterium]|nr:methyltransferase [Gammaproteobacteria bacterium]
MASSSVDLLDAAVGAAIPRHLRWLWDFYASWLTCQLAEAGVADHLGDEPEAAEVLAERAGLDAGMLKRVLHFIVDYGVFEETAGRFRHSPVSRMMRSDHPQSLRPVMRIGVMKIFSQALGLIPQAMRAGRPAMELAAPEGVFAYLAANPDEARVFDEGMTSSSHGEIHAVLGAYDFSPFHTIADIGGGRGHFVSAVLERATSAKGIVFDLPHSLPPAPPPGSRLSLHAGSFFDDPLPSADAYLLKHVIHDWNDADAVRILSSVRRVAPEHARLLVVESVMPDAPGPHWAKLMDAAMLIWTAGRERTRREYEGLMAQTGWRLDRVIDTQGGISILEARPR